MEDTEGMRGKKCAAGGCAGADAKADAVREQFAETVVAGQQSAGVTAAGKQPAEAVAVGQQFVETAAAREQRAETDVAGQQSAGAAAARKQSEEAAVAREQSEEAVAAREQSAETVAAGKQSAECLLPILRDFPFFAGLSLFFGVAYTFCLYKNPGGVTYPLFVATACACGVLACRRLHCPVKRDSWFLIAAAIVLGIGTCRTAEWFLIAVNGLALVLLGSVFAIHQFYEDEEWDPGKYFLSIMRYLAHMIGQVPTPFRHLRSFLRQKGNRQARKTVMIFKGLLLAVPVLCVLIVLLSAADAVFSSLFLNIAWNRFRPGALFHVVLMLACGFFAMYGAVCCCRLRPLKEETPDRRKGEPLTALAFMGSIALVYAVFCAIQVYYLFLGRGKLPEGYSYSDYARQGFFQLLFVACINLVMVLCCLKYIRPDRRLHLLLTLICGCTYIMLASAIYRMVLYVQAYHLTYLRLVTLWFLAMTAVLLAGVSLAVWKPKFRLFRFGLAVVTIFYTALVWARPGEILGWDFVNHLDREQITSADIRYLVKGLSADAAPAVASLNLTGEEVCDAGLWTRWELETAQPAGVRDGEGAVSPENGKEEIWLTEPNYWMRNYYNLHAGRNYMHMGIRNFNFALARVKALIPE